MAVHSDTLRQRVTSNAKDGVDPAPPSTDESSCSDAGSSSGVEPSDDTSSSLETTKKPFLAASSNDRNSSNSHLPWLGLLVWPAMLALPLVLLHTTQFHYSNIFPRDWYALKSDQWLNDEIEVGGIWHWGTQHLSWSKNNASIGNQQQHQQQYDHHHVEKVPMRHPLGLTLGISAVAIGHFFLLIYFRLHQQQLLGKTTPIQSRGAVPYIYSEALQNHLAQPGGFLLLGMYLTFTWVFDLLPHSYYSFEGGIQYANVALCLMCQDAVQFLMHKLEHVAHPKMYRLSHKPHHKFTNPKLFDAFDGSVPDTAIMILIPLFITAHVVRTCNVWTYMAFGSMYANWLTLIHSEVTFPWEKYFRMVGLGTAADHHVHHKFFKWNFGHLFLWWDMVWGSYRDPKEVWGKEFNVGV